MSGDPDPTPSLRQQVFCHLAGACYVLLLCHAAYGLNLLLSDLLGAAITISRLCGGVLLMFGVFLPLFFLAALGSRGGRGRAMEALEEEETSYGTFENRR